jgi:MFS family permease
MYLLLMFAKDSQIMAKALGGSAIEAFWSGTSFLLTSTVFQPVLGSFSHIFGRKILIYISLGFFLVGSIIAAVAGNFTVVLVGRSIQGVGGGGIICLTEMVVVDTVPLRERGKWFSFFGAMWSVGTVAGPLLGKSHQIKQST